MNILTKIKTFNLQESCWVFLDGERISVRIALFELVVENSVKLVISRKI
jgi:hypothetical protein